MAITLSLILVAGIATPAAFAGVKPGVGLAEMTSTFVPNVAPDHIEVGDAGALPATADIVDGSGPLNSIAGTLTSDPDDREDMYEICITDPAAFSAETSGQFDEQLFLFDSNGLGIISDDDSGPGLESLLPAGDPNSPMAVGIYYLAISDFNHDPNDGVGLIFPEFGGPNGPVSALPIAGWTPANPAYGTYSIALTGTSGHEDCNVAVGGELLSIDTTALILAGAQTNAVWIMSALAVIGSVAFGALYITSKKN